MRTVNDTNVLVPAIFFGGVPGRVLAAWRDGRVSVVLSPEILEEYQRAGNEIALRHPGADEAPHAVLRVIARDAEFVVPTALDVVVTDDPDDEKFLACAQTGHAEVIVSGDKHLLRVSGWRGVRVLTPRQLDAELKERAR
ncbi:MAG: putative toxin-antitoxin system toxin component, PIN family [Gemmatimonadetes bacterium]|nr:putative toxin-antitoxin system toxin component, PIN family [Gemmatimonadota bacterium]